MLSVASIVYSFSVSPSSDFVYSISPDSSVSLFVDQPSSFPWRAQSGILQRQDGFGSWQNYTGGMNQFFDDYGIATLSDIFSLSSSIGTFPFSFTTRTPGSSLNSDPYTADSLVSFLQTYLSNFSDVFLSPVGNYYLSSSGKTALSSTSMTINSLYRNGLMGLSSNLLGPTGSFLFNDSTGGFVDVSSIAGGLQQVNSNLLSWLSSSGQVSILGTDGQSLSIVDTNLELDTRYGFLGLANLLRGTNTSSGVPMSFIDYKTGQSQASRIFSTSLFDLNAAGFEGIQNLLALYLFSHGTDLDIKERENMSDQANAFVDDFTDPNGGGTPSTGSINDTAGVSSGIKDVFLSDSTVSDIFVQANDSNNFSFFSSQTQNELNPGYNSRFYFDDDFIDFLSPHLEEIDSKVGSSW